MRHGTRLGAEEEGPPDLEQNRRVDHRQPLDERSLPESQPQRRESERRQHGYEDLPERPVGGEVLPFRGKHLVDGRARVLRSGEPEHAGYQREEGERDVPQRLHL
jgi:hypothetical protein